jgi:hypothetical protein
VICKINLSIIPYITFAKLNSSNEVGIIMRFIFRHLFLFLFLLTSCEISPKEGDVSIVLLPPISVSSVRAVILSQLLEDGNQEIIDRGYIYYDLKNQSEAEIRVPDLRRYGTIQYKLFNLNSGTSYLVRAYVLTKKGEYVSNEISFETEPISTQVFKIGEKGPGGGLVFLDWGDYSRGYRYMETRSLEAAFYDNFIWSIPEFKNIGTSRLVGSGEINTDLHLQKILITSPLNAFYSVSVFEKNGYQDWFIPSIEELLLVFKTLSPDKVSEEFEQVNSDRFLSSTEIDSDRIYVISANNQTESTMLKSIGHNALAIRVY